MSTRQGQVGSDIRQALASTPVPRRMSLLVLDCRVRASYGLRLYAKAPSRFRETFCSETIQRCPHLIPFIYYRLVRCVTIYQRWLPPLPHSLSAGHARSSSRERNVDPYQVNASASPPLHQHRPAGGSRGDIRARRPAERLRMLRLLVSWIRSAP